MGAVVCFGELLIRLTAPGRTLLMQTPALDLHVGGAEANVAIGLACLGHDTAMVSAVPDNALGRGAMSAVRTHGVDTRAVTTRDGRMGLYFLSPGAGLRASEIVYDRAHSAFATTPADAFDWPALLAGAARLHLSGITPALGPVPAQGAIAAAEAATALGVPVSFDGNYRARLWEAWDSDPRAILTQLIGHADILFGNHQDVALLLGRDFPGGGSDRRRAAADAAFAAFPRLQLIASTARHTEDADRHRIAARIDTRDASAQTDEVLVSGIVDRIGAGDAFAAGVLHGLSEGDIDHAARIGLALACLKHSLPGDASLFGRADIAAFLAGGLDVRR
ncbi:sugar kinase [Polymorphobacter fuscus]|uniref:Sugar kinase n=1 Tax=Sandarakinorhabdus fusca TaxID=1439888 RepID=A0A7C9GQY5_9SPHN|nr:sugar kinase [Polymorphobacter fuscus]KAB7643632.1 sugar kinase [Polymorphobacter fuscus]MQT18715.1 sugar kinase [Polymorphobacter fuscus]NJC09605.1 2-dehydro-3-deoxygluconokinase [Polymorphobacter fuscus]